jgi:superfamily II DNA/RNA helicase
MNAFAALGLSPRLVETLTNEGIDAPFPVQSITLPDALTGRDLCGKAPTGSGKTLAYGLAVVQLCRKANRRMPSALILVPTRELAQQVAKGVGSLRFMVVLA